MKHAELQNGDIVVFKKYSRVLEEEAYQDGNIIYVNIEKKTAVICYLDGYKSEVDDVPFEKIIAKHDRDGELMQFGCLSGKSVLLEKPS